eukprot:TRINITY_DN45321_c0_g1_i2.p1 TRINITY_DN45321_c0_g1~~TRINITY_DN45321_c0_g1_i2.p1  ORF type:complete len:105 (+),score=11.76 TRINITY_DN45321_c0_g1_i2:1090-1404(+)
MVSAHWASSAAMAVEFDCARASRSAREKPNPIASLLENAFFFLFSCTSEMFFSLVYWCWWDGTIGVECWFGFGLEKIPRRTVDRQGSRKLFPVHKSLCGILKYY